MTSDRLVKPSIEKCIKDAQNDIDYICWKRFPGFSHYYYEDMCQAARIAIVRQYDQYNPNGTASPNTYFRKYMLGAIVRFLSNDILHISHNRFDEIGKVNRVINDLAISGQDITDETIAAHIPEYGLLRIRRINEIRNTGEVRTTTSLKVLHLAEMIKKHPDAFAAIYLKMNNRHKKMAAEMFFSDGAPISIKEVADKTRIKYCTVDCFVFYTAKKMQKQIENQRG